VPQPNAFTGAALDRAADGRRRDGAWLAAQRAHPHARALIAGSAGVRAAGDTIELEPLESALDGGAAAPILLGLDAAGPVFALDEDVPVDGAPPASSARPGAAASRGRRREAGWGCARPPRCSRRPREACWPTRPRC